MPRTGFTTNTSNEWGNNVYRCPLSLNQGISRGHCNNKGRYISSWQIPIVCLSHMQLSGVLFEEHLLIVPH